MPTCLVTIYLVSIYLVSMMILLAEILTALWFFVLGACLGSFLNVVIYRVPRRMTLLGKSHCPDCHQPISFRDNIPVIAWWILGGRCRNCGLPIAARYWQIELTVAMLWFILAVVEIAFGGINLPIRPPQYFGFAFNLMGQRWELVISMLLHTALIMQLLVWTMIAWDGYGVAMRWSLPYFVATSVLVGLAPQVHYGCGWAVTAEISTAVHLGWDLLFGGCVGYCVVAYCGCPSRLSADRSAGATSMVCLMAVAFTLGSGCMPTLAILTCLFAEWFSRRSLPLAGAIGAAAIVQILLWRPLNELQIVLGVSNSAFHLVLATTAIFMLVPLIFRFSRPKLDHQTVS